MEGKHARGKVGAMRVLVRVREGRGVGLKHWLPVLVALLEDSDGAVRDEAKIVSPSAPICLEPVGLTFLEDARATAVAGGCTTLSTRRAAQDDAEPWDETRVGRRDHGVACGATGGGTRGGRGTARCRGGGQGCCE
jgi:hypothetical protein